MHSCRHLPPDPFVVSSMDDDVKANASTPDGSDVVATTSHVMESIIGNALKMDGTRGIEAWQQSSAYMFIKLIIKWFFSCPVCCFHEAKEKASIRILTLDIMHALIQASLVLLFISPRATAKPIAIGSDFSSDYSLFTGDDSELLGAGDDLGLVDPSDDVSALIAVDSACSSDVSLSNDDDLFVRDLDDTLLLGKKPATCVNPDQSSGSDRQKLELPQFEMLAPIDGTTSDGRCNTYGQSVLACCDYSKSTSPTNCVACT